jgi:hypothetical protein
MGHPQWSDRVKDRHGRVPYEDLVKLIEFDLLTAQQKEFIREYIANGYKAQAAIEATYPNVKRGESSRIMAHKTLNSVNVVVVLSLHFGDEPEKRFIDMVLRLMSRKKISERHVKLMRLLADIHGFRYKGTSWYDFKVKDGIEKNKQLVIQQIRTAKNKKESQEAIERAAQTATLPDPAAPNLLKDFVEL